MLVRHFEDGSNVCSPETTATDKLKAHGAMVSVQAVFAMWCIIGHIVLADNDPLVFALAREIISSGALLALAVGLEGEVRVHNREDAVDIFVLVRRPSWPYHLHAVFLVVANCVFCSRSEAQIIYNCGTSIPLFKMQGLMAFAVVMGFMFALSDVPDVQVAVAQPIVPALSLGMSAALGMEKLSWVSGLGIFFSVTGMVIVQFVVPKPAR